MDYLIVGIGGGIITLFLLFVIVRYLVLVPNELERIRKELEKLNDKHFEE